MGNPESRQGDGTQRSGRLGVLSASILVAALLTLAVTALSVSAAEPEIPPIVTTSAPVAGSGGYTLKGTIYTYSLDTHYHFEYGTSTAYGTNVPIPDADAGTTPVVQVSQLVTGLSPNTTYHFRIVASNSKGPGESTDRTFSTTETSTPPPPYGEEPQPSGEGPPKPGSKVKLKIVTIKGKRILGSSKGHTLYSLSAEKDGKFICTKSSGCLAIWKPLAIPSGGSVIGPVKLGSIKRPEGGRQATFRGLPLYTFVEDAKPGEANGEGLKDVGTWHAVKVPKPKR